MIIDPFLRHERASISAQNVKGVLGSQWDCVLRNELILQSIGKIESPYLIRTERHQHSEQPGYTTLTCPSPPIRSQNGTAALGMLSAQTVDSLALLSGQYPALRCVIRTFEIKDRLRDLLLHHGRCRTRCVPALTAQSRRRTSLPRNGWSAMNRIAGLFEWRAERLCTPGSGCSA